MLEGLFAVCEKLRQRIHDHRSFIGSYEIRTRASLVDPMLQALGWDVGDPAMVKLEEPDAQGGRPDYALLGTNDKPVMLIEAKKLAVTKPPVAQVVTYVATENFSGSSNYKVHWCGWTNGDSWELYDVLRQTRIVSVSLNTTT